MRYHHNRSGKLIEIEAIERDRGKFQICTAALFRCPQQDHTSVIPGRMSSQVGKSFIGSHQPAPLILDSGPEDIIGNSLPTLPHNRKCVMAPRNKEVGYLMRQIFVEFETRAQWPLVR
jgi:hypothetical protein